MRYLYLPVQGTHSWSETPGKDWWQDGSPFTEYLKTQELDLINPQDPFVWSTDVNGASFWRRWLPWHKKDGDHRDWKAGGAALRFYLDGVDLRHRNLIAHSHGLQVVLYAACKGFPIHRLVSVGSPIRGDMAKIAVAARPAIGYWLHIYDMQDDRMQMLGGIGDGSFGIKRTAPLANKNVGLKAISHSKILHQPELFKLWAADGWLDVLKGGPGVR
jgi:hypothetical protein